MNYYTASKQYMTTQNSGHFLQNFSQSIYEGFTSVSTYEHVLVIILKIIIWYIGARILIRFGTAFINRLFQHRALRFNERRMRTLDVLSANVLRYVVYFVLLFAILELLGVPVATLLAGASFLGVAVGFGAQNLVRDILTGFFILFEDQFAVGDSIQTGQFKGTVEEIGLRITKIRAWTGEVFILPNSSITQVTNFSKANSLAVIDIGVSYDEDLDRVFEVIKSVMEKAKLELPDMVGDPQVMGVQQFAASEVIVRATVDCKPTMNSAVQRELNRRIKKKFDELGITIPYPHQVMVIPQQTVQVQQADQQQIDADQNSNQQKQQSVEKS